MTEGLQNARFEIRNSKSEIRNPKSEIRNSDSVLVIGGGIAGIQAALDLAEAGSKVVLVEREPAIGGVMAALDKNFPTLDCSICIEAPKMREVMEHDNIETLTLAEVTGVRGEAGVFTVSIHQKSRFVTDECTRCDDCVPVCPELRVNEFDVGMGARKAIYTPFAQAEPGAYVIDIESCLNEPPNYLPCARCVEACAPKCIDFDMLPRNLTRQVSAIIVATGFDLLNPQRLPEYSYGRHPDVLTSLEFERLLNAAGPSDGHIVRPSDGRPPENILFVLCVGSRDQRHVPYCSRVCCMYSTKEALQAIDHGVSDITILYMDIRAYGKGFDAFYDRTRSEGVTYIRGRPARVAPSNGRLQVRYENTEAGRVQDQLFDMVVLAPAIVPSGGTPELAEVLGVELDEDGFFAATAMAGGVIATTRSGIYVCGSAAGPKDIADSVAEASGAASAAVTHVNRRTWPQPLDVEPVPADGDARVGVFVCDCGSNIAGTVDVPNVVEHARQLDGVVHAEEMRFACSGADQERMTQLVREAGLNRCLVAACSPRTHCPIFQLAAEKAGLNPYLVEMANIRDQDSWVHKKHPEAATVKARDLVHMGVEKAKRLQPLETVTQPVTQRALVVGGGIAGLTAATNLAQQGFETHLVEREPELGGLLRELDELAPDSLSAQALLADRIRLAEQAGVHLHTNAEVENISGFVGNFTATLQIRNPKSEIRNSITLDIGAVVLATGAEPYQPTEFGYGEDPHVVTNLELEQMMASGDGVSAERITFVSCVGSRNAPQGCSRYCCQTMIHQALRLREQGKHVRVLYKDIRTVGRGAEELYERACRAGVQFLQYDQDAQPEEALRWEAGRVIFHDELIDHDVAVPTDLLVLTVGLRPTSQIRNPKSETCPELSRRVRNPNGVAQQLKVSLSEDGFLLERHPKLGPVEAAVAGVFMAGTAQGPKDIHESVSQALAAASKAGALLARDTIKQEPLAAVIDQEACTGCTLCGRVCPYGAIEVEVKQPAVLNPALCLGCGACAAECPPDAIAMPGFTDEQITAQIDAALAENPEEKVLVFACNWCSYAGADQAGIAKVQYPPSSRVIRTMCSGRVDQKFVMHAFERGAGAVLVSGCHLGDCHYIDANEQTAKRVPLWQKRLKHKDIDPERLQLAWVSAAEGRQFAEKMQEMHEIVQRRLAEREPALA